MLEQVRKFYPNAVESGTLFKQLFEVFSSRFGLEPKQVLLANSICADDVNAIQNPDEARQMLGPFNLGGLDGYPFTGVTGMTAYAHHVPEDGATLVFYGPHIGVTEQGELGKILRVGQSGGSSCCGAAVAALGFISNGNTPAPQAPADDYQQYTLNSILHGQRDRILGAKEKLHEATEVIFEASSQQIDNIIRQTSFTDRPLFVAGVILINGDRDHGSFYELRRFQQIDPKTKEVLADLMPPVA